MGTLVQHDRSRRRRPTGGSPPLPYRLQTSGIGWLIAAVVLIALAMAAFAGSDGGGRLVAVTVADVAAARWLGHPGIPGLLGLLRGVARVGSWTSLVVVWWALFAALVVTRRWRHLVVWIIAWNVVRFVSEVLVGSIAQRPRPFGVEILTGWGGFAMPSTTVAAWAATMIAILYTLVPEGRARNTGKLVMAGLVVLLGLARIAVGVDAPSDVLVGLGIGVTVPLIAFRRFTPGEVFPVTYRRGRSAHLDVGGSRGEAIRRAVQDQLGLVVDKVAPFGLSGSAGSTPLRIVVKGDPPTILFGKLYAKSHLRADRWYKLGRELLYGRLEDEKPFNTVRRLVQQEDYALSLMQRAGLPSPTPYGFVELTPEREYMLVTEFFDGAVELGEAEVDDAIIDDGLRIIRKLWDAGLAHRDIKPANLLVRDGRVLLIDVSFVEARPTPWRQAVDLANMMLCLGLRSSAERVYERALRLFTVDEITEAFAAARGLALPSQLRNMMRAQGLDLHARFARLLPSAPRPIGMQRWSLRRVALWGALVLVAAMLVSSPDMFITGRQATATPLHVDDLDCGHLRPLFLIAQSVPSASMVPCVRARLDGWGVVNVTVNDGRTVVTLRHDRAGMNAVELRLTATCATAGAVEITSPEQGVRRAKLTQPQTAGYQATWFDTFEGGCVTTQLRSGTDTAGRFAEDAAQMLGFTSRVALRKALADRSGGRLRLDPGTGP
jgi:membrane-associated phospholipid phosphatase/tRNA A-37 threonylcarbamoyl transferase component Bud32